MIKPVDENSLREHRRTLGLKSRASADDINAAFRRLSKDAHPDAGGSLDRFTDLQTARNELLEAVDGSAQPSVYLGNRRRPGSSGLIDRQPVWLPGALAALALGLISALVGGIREDRNVLAAGVLTALLAGAAITGLLVLREHYRSRPRRSNRS